MRNFFAIFVLLWQILPAATTDGWIEKGNRAYQSGRYAEAYRLYKSGWENGENSAMARFNMANSLYQLKQVGRALALYEHILQENPTFIRPYINAGGIYFSMNEIGNALQMYGRALEIDPGNSTAIKMAGECWLKLGDKAKALEFFEKGSRNEPTILSWYYAMVDVYVSLSDYASAIAIVKRAMAETGDNAQLLFFLAELEIAVGEREHAIVHLHQGLDLDPERTEAWLRLTSTHESMENLQLAIQTLQEGMRGGYLEKSVHNDLGRLYMEAGEPAQAYDHYCIAARNGDERAKDGLLLVAYKYKELGYARKAKEVLLETAKLFPGDPEVKDALTDGEG